jgi:hypothetical protein
MLHGACSPFTSISRDRTVVAMVVIMAVPMQGSRKGSDAVEAGSLCHVCSVSSSYGNEQRSSTTTSGRQKQTCLLVAPAGQGRFDIYATAILLHRASSLEVVKLETRLNCFTVAPLHLHAQPLRRRVTLHIMLGSIRDMEVLWLLVLHTRKRPLSMNRTMPPSSCRALPQLRNSGSSHPNPHHIRVTAAAATKLQVTD